MSTSDKGPDDFSAEEILKLLTQGQEKLDQHIDKNFYKLPEFDNPLDRPVMLVVDDEQGYIDKLNNCIKEWFPKSIKFHSINPLDFQGQDVVDIIEKYHEETRIDLIILDRNMPGQNGMECLGKIRKLEKLKYIPIFFVTQSSFQTARRTAMLASQAGAQRTIFFKKPDSKLVYDIITSLDSALDELLDRRWTDLLARFSELIHESQKKNSRQQPASKHIDDILIEGGKIIEEILGYECLIRENKVGDNTLRLKFDTFKKHPNGFLEIPANDIPMFHKLIENDSTNVIAFDKLTFSDLGYTNALKSYIGRPTLISKIVYKNHCPGTLALYKEKNEQPFREKDKRFIENLVLQMSIYIAEYRDARELRTHQGSIAKFGAEISVKDNISDVIQMLGERLHDEINHGEDKTTKTTIRMLSHSEAELKRVFHRGMAPVCNESISLENYSQSNHAKAAISLQSVFNQNLKLSQKAPFISDERMCSSLTVPLKWQNIILGTVNLESAEDYYYLDNDRNLVETLCNLTASTIYSLRQATFQKNIFRIVKQIGELTSHSLFDEVISALFDFIPFRNLVGLSRNKRSDWDYDVEFVYSHNKTKLEKEENNTYWSTHLHRNWEQTYIYETIHQKTDSLFSIMHQREWDNTRNKEIKNNKYHDEEESFPGRPTRTQVVIKIMGLDAKDDDLPKHILLIQYPVSIFDDSWEEGMLREFCELASSLLSNIENVNWLYGERYIAQQQAKLTKAYSNINHGIRSKMGIISNYLKMVENENSRDEAIANIRDTIYATEGLINGLSLYVKIPKPEHHFFYDIWNDATQDIKHEIASRNVPISILPFNSNIKIYTDKDILKIVLFNLAQNAFEHILLQSCDDGKECEGGPFNIWAEIVELEREIEIFVSNTGSKIMIKEEEVFEMGVSGKGSGAGTGLHYSKNKIEELHGQLNFEERAGEGVTFKLTLPKKGGN